MPFDDALNEFLRNSAKQRGPGLDRQRPDRPDRDHRHRDRSDNDHRQSKPQRSGIVSMFDIRRGYGLVTDDQDGNNVFTHITAMQAGGLPEPRVGDRVRFDIGERKGGKAVAINIRAA